ncbi:MAG: SIS domain-containing protein [Ktedonobacteraceae bacterium]|nr:SIS domain-containing protein [Ktedonobacteraceae bacterium]
MYDAIQAQPQAFASVVKHVAGDAERIAARMAGAQRIFLIGIGTSLHAAQAAYHLLQHYHLSTPVQVMQAFDLALYGPALSAEDCVVLISHRGTKRYGLAAIQRAREAGCYTVLITGEGEPESAHYADDVIKTVAQDRSSAHTVSYIGAQAALAVLAAACGRRQGEPVQSTFLEEEIPAIMRACLHTEEQVRALAQERRQHRRIWLVGGGPSSITAQEIALKIKETSYLQAEGMTVETMLHGPFQCVEPQDLFVLIAPAGPAQERMGELAAMVQAVGAPYVLVDDGSAAALRQQAVAVISVPPVAEAFTTVTGVIPLQLWSYYLALACGTNPDGFRLEDPRFARAYQLAPL